MRTPSVRKTGKETKDIQCNPEYVVSLLWWSLGDGVQWRDGAIEAGVEVRDCVGCSCGDMPNLYPHVTRCAQKYVYYQVFVNTRAM